MTSEIRLVARTIQGYRKKRVRIESHEHNGLRDAVIEALVHVELQAKGLRGRVQS